MSLSLYALDTACINTAFDRRYMNRVFLLKKDVLCNATIVTSPITFSIA